MRIEVFAGTTTFMAAAYLAIVIPGILTSGGMDLAAVTTSTIVMFFAGTLGMALYANLPFVVGPGIGGAAIVATTLAVTEGVPWQTGMAIAFWSGVLFLLLTLLGMREVVAQLIPAPIKLGLSAALGGFVAMLGFRNAGMVVANARVNALTLGDFSSRGAILTLIGLAVAIALRHRKIPGAILLAIILATLIGLPLGVTKLPQTFFGLPHGMGAVTFKLNPLAALRPSLFPYLFAFFAAEFFSTMGTTLAVDDKAGMLDERGNMPGINGPFVVDSCQCIFGDQPTEHAALAMHELTRLVEKQPVEDPGKAPADETERKAAILETLECEINMQKSREEIENNLEAIEIASDLQEPPGPTLDILLRYRASNTREFKVLLDSLHRVRGLRRITA